jgi:hypothetical protein
MLDMGRSTRASFTWKGSAARLDRLAKANAQADGDWLRSLSIEDSVLLFEDLSRGIPELSEHPDLDPPPVVLWRLWRS